MADAVADAGPVDSFPEFDAEPAPAPAPKEAPAAAAPAAEPPKAPDKGADGATKEEPTPPADAKTHSDESAAADEAAEPEPGPFSFAGRTFKDSAAAEHYLKTQEGRAKAEAKRVAAEAKARADAETKVTEAIRAAEYWKAEAEKRAQPQAKPTEQTKEPEKPWIQDPKLWSDVRKLADEEGIDAAVYHALDKARGYMSKEFEAKLEAELAPFRKQAQAEKLKDYTARLFEAAENFIGGDGQPLYPELREPESYAAIAQIWATLDPRFALTERGVDYAVLRHRAEMAGRKPAAQVATPAPSGASEVVKRASDEKNKPAEDLNGGGVPRPGDANDPKARSRRLLGGDLPVLAAGGESLGFME